MLWHSPAYESASKVEQQRIFEFALSDASRATGSRKIYAGNDSLYCDFFDGLRGYTWPIILTPSLTCSARKRSSPGAPYFIRASPREQASPGFLPISRAFSHRLLPHISRSLFSRLVYLYNVFSATYHNPRPHYVFETSRMRPLFSASAIHPLFPQEFTAYI